MKLGPVGAVAEPKSHSATVRFEGKWAVRDLDRWWLNNRNTDAKLYWVESLEMFAPTPAIENTQTARAL